MHTDPPHTFAVGDRVRVSDEWHWARGASGTVSRAPQPSSGLPRDWPREHQRVVQMRKGDTLWYWVRFDEGQVDGDGDGPYREAEIESAYLIPHPDAP